MIDPSEDASTDSAVALARAALERPQCPFPDLPERLIVVNVDRQSLSLVERGRVTESWPVSTATAGVGGASGSQRTPPGWHLVHARIGAGAPSGSVFESRAATGEVWRDEARAEDLILSRVLTLDGIEEGVNRGASSRLTSMP